MMPPNFDPSKMDPKVLMELSRMVQQLPPEQLNRMQSLMHNMMAGHDVRREMEEFERSLPPGFREKLISIMGPSAMGGMGMGGAFGGAPSASSESVIDVTPSASTSASSTDAEMNLREARLTILRGVADGRLSPEEAERLLFQE